MSQPQKVGNVAGSREFDPLSTQKSVDENTQNKVMSSFGISNDGVYIFIGQVMRYDLNCFESNVKPKQNSLYILTYPVFDGHLFSRILKFGHAFNISRAE